MGSARCPIVLRIFKARRPLTSSVRCIDGVCGSGRVLSKHYNLLIILLFSYFFCGDPFETLGNEDDPKWLISISYWSEQ